MLGWQIAAVGALCLLLAAGLILLLRPKGRVGRVAVAAIGEAGVVLGLFAAWQLAGTLAHRSAAGAVGRGNRLLSIEAAMHIANEHHIQNLITPHALFTQMCNAYYVYGHFNGLILFLAWVFFAHRRHYPSVRLTVILVTAASFVLHLIAVAPPRLLAGEGFIDTAVQYGQSVYGPTTVEVADQLSAFPSVHVAWAAIIAYWAWRVSPGRWGWVGIAHFVATSFVVVATANHYWLDGIAAVGLLVLALLLQTYVPAMFRTSRGRAAPAPAAEEPALV
jgi:hypothetical protein